jgi:selenocysteine-specific elongation factor
VPGHERFVKNMLAGASGIDLVLMVIAADESIKPQTREHFHICRLLGIRQGIIALTKADLVPPDLVELVRLEVEEFVAGSFLEGAPIVPVSAVTGEGLDRLRSEMMRIAVGTTEKDVSRHFRLPIDRSFVMHGFGTVVTGTLISGAIAREQEVEVHPISKRVRVRGIQVHGSSVNRATAGQRTALNLADVEAVELTRGMMLTVPGVFKPVRELDCQITLLDSAPEMKHGTPVHFHWASAEIEAELRLLGRSVMAAGESGFARIVLKEPAQVLPGDRFIIRRFSPVTTIGGGVVIDISGKRHRRSGDAAGRLSRLTGPPEERIAVLAAESVGGVGRAELIARTGLTDLEIETAAGSKRFHVLRQPELHFLDASWFSEALNRLTAAVSEFHKANPLLPGVPKQDLRGRHLPRIPAFAADAILGSAPELLTEGDLVRHRSHRLVLKEDEQRARSAIEGAFEQAGLAVPSVAEVLEKSGVEAGRARSLLQILIREKRLARINEDLVFHQSAIGALRGLLGERKGERFGVAQFKEWTGISRKYAIPLLEYMDRERVTRRDGADRIIL